MWFKARILFTEVMAAYACVRALMRRQMVYGVMVAPGDPQLMEGGGTCPICQVRSSDSAAAKILSLRAVRKALPGQREGLRCRVLCRMQ